MAEQSLVNYNIWVILIYTGLVVTITGGMLLLSYFLGQRHSEKSTDTPFESGIPGTGNARLRFPVHYYIVAMFFVIFDLEAAFIILWAVSFQETGWIGYWGILVFIIILLAVLVYEWKSGALDFGPSGKKILQAYRKQKKGH